MGVGWGGVLSGKLRYQPIFSHPYMPTDRIFRATKVFEFRCVTTALLLLLFCPWSSIVSASIWAGREGCEFEFRYGKDTIQIIREPGQRPAAGPHTYPTVEYERQSLPLSTGQRIYGAHWQINREILRGVLVNFTKICFSFKISTKQF